MRTHLHLILRSGYVPCRGGGEECRGIRSMAITASPRDKAWAVVPFREALSRVERRLHVTTSWSHFSCESGRELSPQWGSKASDDWRSGCAACRERIRSSHGLRSSFAAQRHARNEATVSATRHGEERKARFPGVEGGRTYADVWPLSARRARLRSWTASSTTLRSSPSKARAPINARDVHRDRAAGRRYCSSRRTGRVIACRRSCGFSDPMTIHGSPYHGPAM